MSDFLSDINPIAQALIAGCFTWLVTALGASAVFTVRNINKKLLDGMLGFAAGVMIAASYWSLLAPAIEMSEGKNIPSWIPPAVGFLSGAIFLRVVDALLPHLHAGLKVSEAEGIKTRWHKTTLLILAITLHNIPEGLAVGVAFGAAGAGLQSATLGGAVALAIGIGLQNFPEGMAVSMPLRRERLSRFKSFWIGQLSGIVEPVAAVAGAAAVGLSQPILPYALSFAAGAMIFVTVEELIPESQRDGNTDAATMGAIIGFTVMMMLDVGLG
jgi:ZIP family zinc transporter